MLLDYACTHELVAHGLCSYSPALVPSCHTTQEIQKYRPRALRPGLLKDRGAPQLGGQRLRHLAGQVRELINDLRQYRPSRGEGRGSVVCAYVEGKQNECAPLPVCAFEGRGQVNTKPKRRCYGSVRGLLARAAPGLRALLAAAHAASPHALFGPSLL